MPIFLLLVALGVIVISIAVALGKVEGGLDEPARAWLPGGLDPIDPAGLSDVRFTTALRGYRMAEVDELLDRLAAELASRDAQIARLRGEAPDAVPSDPDARRWLDKRPSEGQPDAEPQPGEVPPAAEEPPAADD